MSLQKPIAGSGRLERYTRRLEARRAVEDAIKAANRRGQDSLMAIRQAAFERDHGRCRVFGDELRFGVSGLHGGAESHHVIFRSQGGTDELSNIITLSKRAHDLIHAGLLELEGNANETITIRLYKFEGGTRTMLRTWESPCPS